LQQENTNVIRKKGIFAALASAALMAGCGAPQPVEVVRTVEVVVTSEPKIVEKEVEKVVEVTAEPAVAGKLVVYSGRSESLVGPVIAQFEEISGVDVEVRYGSTSEMAATILEEGANSPADVFFAQDPGGLGAVANAGLFAVLPQEVISDVKPALRAADGSWTGVSGRARVVVYNTDKVKPEDLPADVYDFIDPKWKGRIGWAPKNASLQAMVTAMRVMWGEDKTRAWLQGMQANEAKSFEGNSQVVQAAGAGEIEVGLVNHYYLYRFLKEQGDGFKARNHFQAGNQPGALLMVAGVGHLKNGKNAANAEKFIKFLLSKVGQQYFVSQTNEYPVIDGIATPTELTPFEELASASVQMTDLTDLKGTVQLMSEVGVLP
jgi:iron(III) transport system substrate-binding protein